MGAGPVAIIVHEILTVHKNEGQVRYKRRRRHLVVRVTISPGQNLAIYDPLCVLQVPGVSLLETEFSQEEEKVVAAPNTLEMKGFGWHRVDGQETEKG